jgi:hypothetical protein
MLALEFVEGKEEQARKNYVAEGKSAAVCLRLTQPWHNTRPHEVIADAYFGGMPTAVSLFKRGFFSITNVKLQTRNFCKKELWADAGGKPWQRDARAYRQTTVHIEGKEVTFVAAFHMDKAPMTLLATTGSSGEAPLVTRRRVYMNEFGDMVRWEGELRQPVVHAEYRSLFNAVDVHNKLALGPRSFCSVGANHLILKVFLALVGMAETNAYLTYMDLNKMSSTQYSHGDFKSDLERELLVHAAKMGTGQEQEEGGAGPALRSAVADVAGGVNASRRMRMPPSFHGHSLTHDTSKRRKCMI